MSGQDSLNHIALWKLLREKMEEEGLQSEFEAGVKEIWKYGLNLSKTIIRFSPPLRSTTKPTLKTFATG